MPAPITPAEIRALISDPTSSLCGNFINTLLKLPVAFYKLVNWMLDMDGNPTDVFITATSQIRPGDLIFSGRADDSDGRLLCNGQAVSRTTYAALYAAIGTAFGMGDGSTTFNVPDYRDKFPIGASATKLVGTTGGEADGVLTEANLPPHQHFLANGDSGGDPAGGGNIDSTTYLLYNSDGVDSRAYRLKGNATVADRGLTSVSGTGTAFNNLPPYVACFIYIKT